MAVRLAPVAGTSEVKHGADLPLPADDPVRAPDDTPPPGAALPAPGSAAVLHRREWVMIFLAVAGGGIVMIGLLTAAGGSSSEAAAAHAAPALTAPAAARPDRPAPEWRVNNEWVDGQRNSIAFELPANDRVAVWQRHAHPVLVVRCVAKQLEAFVFIESAAKMEAQDENHTVRLAFDDRAETTERWPDSYQHDALFAPDGSTFVQQLLGAGTLRFGYTPHNAASVVATFEVSGLSRLLEPAARQCGLAK